MTSSHANATSLSLSTDGLGDFATISAPFSSTLMVKPATVSVYDAAPPTLAPPTFAGGSFAGLPITMTTTGSTAMYSILAVGLFNSIMFPTIFTLAIDGLGKHTGQASGILCMAIVGGALIPVLQGFVADAIGIHHCFIVALLCYVYIAWYGSKGSIPVAPRASA